ncbi:tyrosine-type recombinase/integrase [Listeria innocua]|uniref:tyrosine-type recombinase/integrase n=1 Tax=Listeria innocua TaxID=1642 RepID=UPI001299555C|nr:tyrosine-type recombinase/integrase [Listeria innocua]QGF43642.1 tyrosine-type recombinase/integrase [Listeria innocua]
MRRSNHLSLEEKAIVYQTIVPDDDFVFHEFIRSRRIRNVRETTIQYYTDAINVLKRDMEFIHVQKPIMHLSQRDLEDMIMYWKGFMRANTINSKIKAFKAYYNFLYQQGFIKRNPCENLSLLRVREEIRETLNPDEIKKIANHFKKKETFSSYRDLVIFQLLLDTGIRISEAVGINIQDIHSDYIIVVESKNLKQRIVYISKRMREKLTSYLKIRGNLSHTKVFINRDQLPYNKNTFQQNLREARVLCGIQKQVSPHVCSRTYAKNEILSGMDAFSLATLLGHSSLEVTKRYVQIWGKDLKIQSKFKKDYSHLF